MPSPISAFSNTQTPFSSPSTQTTEADSNNGLSSANQMRAQLSRQILEASLNVSLDSGNQSQALLFRSSIENIYEALGLETQNTPPSPPINGTLDTSPEATADRILSISLGFFDSYAAQHPGEDEEKLATDFINLIRGGFEKGFKEATDILSALGVLQGEVADGIQKTYDIVTKGYDNFIEAHKPKPKPEPYQETT